MRSIAVLMWMHGMVRKRRFILTTVSLVSPVLFFALLFTFRNELNPIPESMKAGGIVQRTEEIRLSDNTPIELEPPIMSATILYTPQSPLTDALMHEVGEKLFLKRLRRFPDKRSSSTDGYFPYTNETQMLAFTNNMKHGDAIIIFHNLKGEEWPTKLNYTIRMKENFNTKTYESEDNIPNSHKMFGLQYLTFMRLQWAIDSSYIKQRSGKYLNQTVSIQEFPYYKTAHNDMMPIICKILEVVSWLSLLLVFVDLMCRMLAERSSGIQELIKMVGVYSHTIGFCHYTTVLPSGLIFAIGGTILLKIPPAIIPKTNGFYLFLMLFLYFNTVIALAFVCSYIVKSTEYSATLAVISYGVLWMPMRLLHGYQLPHIVRLLTGFLPHVPMSWFWREICLVEMNGHGITFTNMFMTHYKNNESVFHCYVFLVMQTVIYVCLAGYLSMVRPGKYGQALPWNFMFKKRTEDASKKDVCDTDNEVRRGSKSNQVSPTNSFVNDSSNKRTEDASKKDVCDTDNEVRRGSKSNQVSPTNSFVNDSSNNALRKKKDQKDTDNKMDSDSFNLMQRDNQYFEEPPSGMKVGIFVDHVTKEYPNHKALKDVTLQVFEGEITVLLGHNGAGKTTLMSVITGMTSPTSGQVYVHGFNTMTQQQEVRKHIGLCPQHNVFFPDLTLQEHIMFFTMLKRGSYGEARESSRRLAQQLGLEDKLGELCGALSGGMKRRAQLACALAGDADVLVLDEPTSGLDVESRRELWDLLLSLRGARTVLLSTHFMEEADVLGDRVAALHVGEMRCFATTMFLKKAVGDGYRLTLTTTGPPNVQAITDKIQEKVPDATLKEKTINSVSYNLPATATSSFPKLFTSLEKNRSKLNIDSIGVGASTLEEVFLKLCSDVDAPLDNDEQGFTPESRAAANEMTVKVNGSSALTEPERDSAKYFKGLQGLTVLKLTGPRLYLRQLKVLFLRQISFILFKKWIFLTMQIILPILLIFLVTSQMNEDPNNEDTPSLSIDLDIYGDLPNKRVLYNIQLNESETPLLRTMKDEHPGVEFQPTKEAVEDVLNVGKKNLLEYNKYLTGLEVNDTSAKVLYTTTVRHAAPVAMNQLSNLLGMRYLNWPTSQIFTNNYPIKKIVREPSIKLPKSIEIGVSWVLIITFFIQAAILHCVSLPCRERETGSRHIHIMSGCPSELYWVATLIFHLFITFLFLIIPTVIAAVVFEKDSTIDQVDFIFTLMAILVIGCMTMLSLMYLISFYFNERTTSIILVASLFVFGLFCPLTKAAYELVDKNRDAFFYVLEAFHYIAPPYAMTVASFYSVKIATVNAACELMRDTCPFMFGISVDGWTDDDVEMCCGGAKPRCYFCPGDTPLSSIYILVGQFIVFMILLFMAQRGIFNWLWDKIRNMRYKVLTDANDNAMVRAERTYVENMINKSPADIKTDSILVHDVHKNYNSWFKNCNAVKGISFSVKKGECFGLLGVNGAGKSSTFKMLTAEECTTRGAIFGNGYHLKRGNTRYLQTLGYCPQFFGLDMFLTGTQNLNLLLTLRGLEEETLKKEVKGWLEIVGLEKYASRAVAGYSGGCVRRLGAAAALCGGAGVTLLDEPSAGVDVAARRRLWAALRQGLRQRRAIIITSHSMDEMEALCDRIAIMCAGRVCALGSPAMLRAEHAAGHAVVFKIKHSTTVDEVDGPSDKVTLFKGKLRGTFNCELKDEHKTMLHYHINETMRYSELFGALEKLREQFPSVVEDYAVTETTLEEVFLSFAKGNKPEFV